MQRNASYWPGFPYANLAAIYDVFMPMTYYTWRVSGSDGARSYVTRNIQIIRDEVGTDQEPIHVIGGIANESTNAETRGFVRAVREHGLIGSSFYTFPTTQAAEWPILRSIPSNPVQTRRSRRPRLAGDGQHPGEDVTHPHDVAFHTGHKAGSWNLDVRAYDAQEGEIHVLVNWVLIGTVPAGPRRGMERLEHARDPDAALNDDAANVIVFTVGAESAQWGVTDVSISPAS